MRLISLSVLLVSCSASVLAAQEMGPRNSATVLVLDRGESDLDGGGTFSSARWYAELGSAWPVSPRQGTAVSLGLGRTDWQFDDSGLSQDFTTDEASLSVSFRFPVGNRAAGFVSPTLSYAAETGADAADAVTYGLLGGVAWRLGPNLTLGPGLGVTTTLEDGTQAFPFLLVDWAITDRLSLSTGRGLAATRGPGLTLAFQASEAWRVAISARSEDIEFRLEDDRSGAESGGTVSDRSVPVLVQAEWSPAPRIGVIAFAGAALDGRVRLHDSDGNLVGRSEYESSPLAGLALRVQF